MECIDQQDNTEEERISSAVMPTQTGVDYEWEPVTSTELDLDHKEATPHLYFVTVEFVEGSPSEFVQPFSNLEADTFSPHASSSSEFDHHVSPLDPNMNSTARYSPVYTVTHSPPATGNSSTPPLSPPSPFRVGRPAPHSPYVDAPRSLEAVSTPPYVGNLPGDGPELPVLTETTLTSATSDPKNLLAMDGYFDGSPRLSSEARSSLAVAEGFVVSESATQFCNGISVVVGGPPEEAGANSELLMQAAMNNTQPELGVKADGFGHIQLLISNGDGENIAYSIEGGHPNCIQSMLESMKEHGLVIEDVEDGGDLKLLPEDGDLQLDGNVSLAVDHQEVNRLGSSLLQSQVDGQIIGLDGGVQLGGKVEVVGGEGGLKGAGKYQDMFLDDGTEVGLLSPPPPPRANCKLGGDAGQALPVRRSGRRRHLQDEDTRNISFSTDVKKCEDCYDSANMSCGRHQVQCISDKPVPSRALATLPPLLAVARVQGLPAGHTVCGVFARKHIPKRAQFGPVEGVLEETVVSSGVAGAPSLLQLLVELDDGLMHRLDTSNENRSNWMRFVRPASVAEEQNLIVNQQGQSLYFTTTRAIKPKQELLVWYSATYATRRGLALLEAAHQGGGGQTWPCFECNEKFFSSEDLQKHLNVHDTEKGARSKPRKGKHHYRRKNLTLFKSKKFKNGKFKDKRLHVCNLRRHVELRLCGQQCKDHCHDLGGICRDRFVIRHYDDRRKHKSQYSMIKKHVDRVSREWLCSHCNLKFDNPTILKLHLLAHAAENTDEVETIMGLPSVFQTIYNGAAVLSIADGQAVVCPQCTQEFSSKKKLIEHVSEHGKIPDLDLPRQRRGFNPAKPWKCERCYKSFATEERLQRHMLVHGSEDTKPLQCDICLKRFLNNSALACHVKIHTGKKFYECPICKNTFEQLLDLKEHVLVHSDNGIYTCPQCKKVFDEYGLIRKHIRAFHCDRKHKCSYCPKQFPTLDKLKMHMLRHSDHREFLCANCGKQFKRKDKLKEHMNRMHTAEKDVKPVVKPLRSHLTKKFMPKISPNDYSRFIYKCHNCLVGFKRRGMLVNHLAKRHPEISPDSVPELNLPILKTTRDYYCQYCDKVYKSSSKRKAHILKNHPGSELPMSNRRKGGVPDIPGQPNPTYSQTVGSVTMHPHGCSWCHKQYASKAKLLQHQRKKHPDLLSLTQQVPQSPEDCGNLGQPESPAADVPDVQQRHIEVQLHGLESMNIIPEFQISATEEELQQYQESGIIIDASSLKQVKDLGDGVSVDLLSQAMSELGQSMGEFRVSLGTAASDHYLKIVHASSEQMAGPCPADDPETVSLSLPPSPPSWASVQPPYVPYTAR